MQPPAPPEAPLKPLSDRARSPYIPISNSDVYQSTKQVSASSSTLPVLPVLPARRLRRSARPPLCDALVILAPLSLAVLLLSYLSPRCHVVEGERDT